MAHRLSYIAFIGPIPDGMCVLHRCDRPACINPEHLWLGTDADNMRDKCEKGRHRCGAGESHGMAKLTDADVSAIRSKYATGNILQRELAAEFGVAQSHVSMILAGKKRKTGR